MPDISLMPESPLSIMPGGKKQPRMREFGDAPSTRQLIYDKVLDAARNVEPLANDRHTLHLKDVDWADPEHFPKGKRKQAILTGETVARRMKGTWELVDNATGKVLDRRQQVVARVPYLSSMGTFVHRGNEYTVNHQQRLLPGMYTRQKDNGEIETHVNIMPGKGVSHRYFLDPEKGVFKIKLGQSEMPLLPLLHHLGASDRELREAWGPELHQSNWKANDQTTIHKLQARLLRKADSEQDEAHKGKALRQAFESMEMDPEVNRRTLGRGHKNVTKDAIIDATKRLLSVSRGEAKPDDRDHLAYQSFYGPEDLFEERVRRDHGRLRQGLFKKVSSAGSLDKMPSGALTPQIEQVLLGSGLAQALEEINPAEVFDKQSRITRMGEGGIPSLDAIPDEARSVQPSHMGFMDPLRTPECYDKDTEVMTRTGWVAWPEVTDDMELACLLEGKLEWRRPSRLHVARYVGEMFGVRTATLEYLVTPNHRLWVRPKEGNGLYRVETAEESFGRPRVYASSHRPYDGQAVAVFVVPEVDQRSNATKTLPPIDLVDWCELVGWYLGEGLTVWRDPPGDYRVCISQSRSANPDNCDRIEALLNRLAFRWSYNSSMACYVLCGKQLTSYFCQFGYSQDRFIPEEFFDACIDARRALLDSLLRSEGRRDRKGRRYAFCSTSFLLAEGVQRLAFSLGIPTTMTFEKDDRQPQYLGCWIVHLQKRIEREAAKKNYFREDYAGLVYCATVPGGLLYVRRGRTAGHWSGNSFRVGVDLHMARGSRKGDDGRVYTQLRDPRTGKTHLLSPQDIADKVVATPEVLRSRLWQGMKRVPVMKGGRLTYAKKRDIDYVLPHFEDAFSPLANLVPFKSMVKGQRVAMASRMLTQALPLHEAEAPLVQSGLPGSKGDRSFEEEFGRHMGALFADKAGRVESVGPDKISLRHADGTKEEIDLYNHYPFNRKTFIHQTPLVRPGDAYTPGQLLAKSNFTDDKGAAALGTNMRVAYWPYKGYNFEDAQVISESAARKLSSEHMYQHDLEVTDKHKTGLKPFVSLFPSKFDKKQLENIDERGLIRPGTVVEHGQPLILAARQRDSAQNKVHKQHQAGHVDESVVWKHHDPGVVTDVTWGKNGPVVLVKSASPMQVGDKLSGRYGDKGVIAAIVPDHKMPVGEDGNPFEVLLNPLGIISRTNPAQMAEAWLGKIAAKTGKPYKMPDFETDQDLTEWTKQELQRHGLKDTETIVDPERGMKIPNIATGHRFFMKLHHTAECFDAETETLTSRGWVPWPEVRADDLLATVRDGRLVFEYPVQLVQYQFRGELCCYEGRYLDYAVTPNHRLFVSFYHRKDREFFFETAERLEGKRFRVPQFGLPHNTDFTCNIGPETVITVNGVTLKAGDYAELVGWWVSEGYARVTARRAAVVLYQSREANPEHFARLEQLAGELGLPWHRYRANGKDMGVVISSRPLAEHLKQHGTHAGNKRLPRNLLGLGPEILRRTYDAMLAGDGNKQQTPTGPRARYVTVSRGLADDFQELCIRMGLGAIVRRGTERAEMVVRLPSGRSYVSSCRPVWECGIALSRTVAQVDGDRNEGGFSRRYYEGPVYCAEMRTGLLYVRRNGKPMLSGNSKGQGRGSGGYSMDETPSKGGESGCFTGDTLVAVLYPPSPTPGAMVIGNLCKDHCRLQVPTRDPEKFEPTTGRVTDWFHYGAPLSELLEIELANGAVIRVTRNHEFVLSDGSRKRACELKPDDDLMEV